jgi:hypothetical protein
LGWLSVGRAEKRQRTYQHKLARMTNGFVSLSEG